MLRLRPTLVLGNAFLAFTVRAQLGPTLYAAQAHTEQDIEQWGVTLSGPVGRTEGSGGVSGTGAATYTIPIKLPPGTNAMQPQLALTYNSQSGNGQLGMGWSLSGMSSITREGQDVFSDEAYTPIEFSLDDRYLLDGQRLIVTNGGAEGVDGTVYDTRSASFMVMRAHGSFGHGPDHFSAITKDGMRYWYGQGSAKVLTADGTEALAWKLSKAMDPNGNYITYTYEEDPDAEYNEHYLTSIKYTGNAEAGIEPYNEIAFIYSRRADVSTAYVDGSAFHMARLLDAIRIGTEENHQSFHVRRYTLTYAQRSLGVSYLDQVEESGTDVNERFRATIFHYNEPGQAMTRTANATLSGGYVDIFTGDYDGNGISDVLKVDFFYNASYSYAKCHTGLHVYMNGATSSTYDSQFSNYVGTGAQVQVLLENGLTNNLMSTDLDGDRKDDIVVWWIVYDNNEAKWKFSGTLKYISSSTAVDADFAVTSIPVPSTVFQYLDVPRSYIASADFDGDGATEIFTSLWTNNWGNSQAYVYRNGAWVAQTINGTDNATAVAHADHYYVMDYDGDRKFELGAQNHDLSNSFRLLSYGGNNTWTDIYSDATLNEATDRVWPGDFNGDGLHDLLSWNDYDNTWWLQTSTGGGNGAAQDWRTVQMFFAPSLDPLDDPFFIADFNGDGRSDIFRGYQNNSMAFRIHYAKDHGLMGPTFSVTDYTVPDGGENLITLSLGDMNGDGKMDLINRGYYADPIDIYKFWPGSHDRLLAEVADGMGAISQWLHHYLTESAVYHRVSSNTSQGVVIQAPLEVTGQYQTTNGVGGLFTQVFDYEDAWYQTAWRRFVGFQTVKTMDYRTMMKTEQRMHWSTIYGALVPSGTLTRSIVDNQLIGETGTTYYWESLDIPHRYFLAHPHVVTVVDHLANCTTTTTIDDYGPQYNPEHSVTVVAGVETSETTTSWGAYGPYPHPSKKTLVTESRTRTGASTATRTTRNTYSASTGSLTRTDEFDGRPKEVITEWQHHSTGAILHTYHYLNGQPAAEHRHTEFGYDDRYRYIERNTEHLYHQGSDLTRSLRLHHDGRWGVVTTEVGPFGLQTIHTYDNFGRRETTSVPHVPGTPRYTISYVREWSNGPPDHQIYTERVLDESKADVATSYDLLGRDVLVRTEGYNGQDRIVNRSYTARGQLYQETTPHFDQEAHVTTTHDYDTYERLRRITSSLSGATDYTYTYANGQLTTTVTKNLSGQAAQSTSQTKDAAGILTKARDGGGDLRYEHDSWGNITRVMHAGTTLSVMSYDEYGRQVSLNTIDAGTTTYEYDGFGQLVRQVDANNNQVETAYDNLGRIVSRTGPEGETSYEYYYLNGHNLDLMASIEGPEATFSYEYNDAYLRLTHEHRIVNGTDHMTEYGYNDYDQLKSLIYPSGFEIRNTYFPDGSLRRVYGTGNITYFNAIEQNGLGQHVQYELVDGATTTVERAYGFPRRYRGGTVQDLRLRWNFETGNLTERWDRDNGLREAFSYDDLNRLTRAVLDYVDVNGQYLANVSDLDYRYDQFGGTNSRGNLRTREDVGHFNYGARHKITGARNLNYMQQPTAPPMGISLELQEVTYTAFQKTHTVKEVVNGDEYKLAYSYGPDRQRVSSLLMRNGNDEMEKVYAGGYERVIHNGATYEIHNIPGGDGLCAMVVHDVDNDLWTNYAVYKDHLGSILTLTRAVGGSVEHEQAFDAWGRGRNPTSGTYTNLSTPPIWHYRGYTGHEHVKPFVLINMNGRMYDPVNGRMLSADNFVTRGSTQGFNRYSYAQNNPLVFTDPDGNIAWFVVAGVAALGAWQGYEVASAQGYDFSDWQTYAYMVGGAAINVGTLYAGVGLGAPGIEGIAGAFIAGNANTMAWSMMSGGQMDVTYSYGGLSYNFTRRDLSIGTGPVEYSFSRGEFDYLGERGNTWQQNVGFGTETLMAIYQQRDQLFAVDPEKTCSGAAWQIISRFTWELPQTLIGMTTYNLFTSYGSPTLDYHRGATYTTSGYSVAGAFTSGSYIFLCPTCGYMRSHEFGHYMQSRLLGPLYLPLVMIPSLAVTTLDVMLFGALNAENFVIEKWATNLGTKHY